MEEEVKRKSKVEIRAEYVKHMIDVMQTVNDEDNGVYETWLMGGPPDGCSDSEILEFVEDEEWYKDVCQVFAESISELLSTGCWGKDGYSRELFNVRAYRRATEKVKVNTEFEEHLCKTVEVAVPAAVVRNKGIDSIRDTAIAKYESGEVSGRKVTNQRSYDMNSLPKFKLGEVVYAPEFELKDESYWDTDFPDVRDLLKDCEFESGMISKITQSVTGIHYTIEGIGVRSEPYVAKTKRIAIEQSLKALLDHCMYKRDKYQYMIDQTHEEWLRYQK